jgi:hypothetical protein
LRLPSAEEEVEPVDRQLLLCREGVRLVGLGEGAEPQSEVGRGGHRSSLPDVGDTGATRTDGGAAVPAGRRTTTFGGRCVTGHVTKGT